MQKTDIMTGEKAMEASRKTGDWVCAKCNAGLVLKNTLFSYMGMTFSQETFRCPVCGMVFITKDLADGKMAEVEQLTEDK